MKKALLLISILMLSVFTTACINNLAVQELNNKAAEYMKKGDYETAIGRLKSSADLDSSIFETQYNLAVAYTENGDYTEAINTFQKALELKPDSKDTYYAMAVMYENYARDLFAGETKEQQEALKDSDDNQLSSIDMAYVPDKNEIQDVKKYYEAAIEAYDTYLNLAGKSADDAADVTAHVENIKDTIATLDFDTN